MDNPVEEKQASAEDHMTKVEEIDISSGDMSDDQFVEKAVELIGEIKKNDNKTQTQVKCLYSCLIWQYFFGRCGRGH